MKRDQVFLTTVARVHDFEFNVEVAEVFDDMLVRSVPFYTEQQFMIKELGKKFVIPETKTLRCFDAMVLRSLKPFSNGIISPDSCV